jgi:hypothetical protein
MELSSNHRKTLRATFEDPIPSDIAWTDIETLLVALGAEPSEGRGSRVRIYLNGIRTVVHRPHPRKEIDTGVLKSMRRFLKEAGISLEKQGHAEI